MVTTLWHDVEYQCSASYTYTLNSQDTATLEQLIVEDKSHGKMPLFIMAAAGGWGRVEQLISVSIRVAVGVLTYA